MNRLSWDSTGPRRPKGTRRVVGPRPELAAIEEEAELIRVAWDPARRIMPF